MSEFCVFRYLVGLAGDPSDSVHSIRGSDREPVVAPCDRWPGGESEREKNDNCAEDAERAEEQLNEEEKKKEICSAAAENRVPSLVPLIPLIAFFLRDQTIPIESLLQSERPPPV